MDQISQYIFQVPSHFSQFHFSKKAIQILLPLSVFSVLISYSFLLPFLLRRFNTFSIQLFNYGTDRNYIFLFCNGILVFLIKNSGLISTPQLGNDINRETVKNNGNDQEMKALVTENFGLEAEENQGRENGNLGAVVNVENEVLITEAKDDEEQEEEEEDDEFLIIEEEEEEEGIELLSTEELNKKCDDFIKKMKEVIRIEANNQSRFNVSV